MNRNITVFILLILVASSFKYRTKTREQVPALSAVESQTVNVKNAGQQAGKFQEAVMKLQEGNREFAEGQPSTYKALWSHADDVTNFCGSDRQEFKGWESVEKSLDSFNRRISDNKNFKYEKIASQAGHEKGYVLQKEHYTLQDGSKLDLNVTIVFRLENNEWKIVHRQSDELPVPAEAIIAAK